MSLAEFKDKLKILVPLALKKEAKAQAQIIELTQNRLFKFCMLLGNNRELAEDLCQEAYIKAFDQLHKLNAADTFYPWLCQIAKNLFFDFKRKQKEKLSEAEEIKNTQTQNSDLDEIIQVQRVLAVLEPEDRYLLLLIDLEGLSYKETAEQLKISEEAVRSRLHRIRQEFLKILG